MSALALIVAATLAQAGALRSDLALRGGGAVSPVVGAVNLDSCSAQADGYPTLKGGALHVTRAATDSCTSAACGGRATLAHSLCSTDAGAKFASGTVAYQALALTNPTRWCIGVTATRANWAAEYSNLLFAYSLGWSTNYAALRVYIDGSVLFDVYDGAGDLKRGSWVHGFGAGSTHKLIACNSAGTLSLYVDGVQRTLTVSQPGTGVWSAVPGYLFIGNGYDQMYWTGTIARACQGNGRVEVQRCLDAAAQPSRVMAFGDSITAGGIVTTPYPQGMGSILGTGWAVTNFGYGGAQVDYIRTLWQENASGKHPGVITLMGGVNDLRVGTAGATVWALLKSTVDQAIADGSKVVLGTVPPWKNYVQWTAGKQTETEVVNAAIRAYASSAVIVVDSYAALGGTDPATIKAEFDAGDGLHPNQAGTDVLAALFAAGVRQ